MSSINSMKSASSGLCFAKPRAWTEQSTAADGGTSVMLRNLPMLGTWKCPPLWKRKIIFQTFQTFIFWVPAVKFFRGVPLFFSTFLMEVFQQGFSTVSKYVPLAEALVAQIHQHSMHVSFHSVRLPSPASFSCNRLEKYVLHFCTCLLYLSFLSLPSPISHSFIILLFSSFSYGFCLF